MPSKIEIRKNIDQLAQEIKNIHAEKSQHIKQHPGDKDAEKQALEVLNNYLQDLKCQVKDICGVVNRIELLQYAKCALNPTTRQMWTEDNNAYDHSSKLDNNYIGEWISFDNHSDLSGASSENV